MNQELYNKLRVLAELDETSFVYFPTPCSGDECGCVTTEDFARKVDEEHGELMRSLGDECSMKDCTQILKEICDVMIACTSLANSLGIDKKSLMMAVQAVNDDNYERGYHNG